MTLFAKLGLSVLVVLVCALFIYPTAYAFAVDSTLKTWLQYLQMALALASVGCLWAGWPQGAVAGVAAVVLITGAVLLMNR